MKYSDILKSKLDSGSSLEEAISQLKTIGASPTDVMKALLETRKIDLGEAKVILGKSKAWKSIQTKADKLHGKIMIRIKKGAEK